jgi:hypothetical protein
MKVKTRLTYGVAHAGFTHHAFVHAHAGGRICFVGAAEACASASAVARAVEVSSLVVLVELREM